MKKFYILNLILICVVISSLLVFAKAICEDEDTLIDAPPLSPDGCLYYSGLFKSLVSPVGILSADHYVTSAVEQIIFYLARQEKSPPIRPFV